MNSNTTATFVGVKPKHHSIIECQRRRCSVQRLRGVYSIAYKCCQHDGNNVMRIYRGLHEMTQRRLRVIGSCVIELKVLVLVLVLVLGAGVGSAGGS